MHKGSWNDRNFKLGKKLESAWSKLSVVVWQDWFNSYIIFPEPIVFFERNGSSGTAFMVMDSK